MIGKMVEALTLSLSVSRGLNKLDEGVESSLASVAQKNARDKDALREFEGFKNGVEWLS